MKKINTKLTKLLEETNESYYWLGFIIADGHITPQGELRIILDQKDEVHLQKLADYLNINLRKRVTKNNKTLVEISVKSIIWGVKLKEKLKLTDKPKTYNPPSDINYLDNKEKFLSFLCGFIDGDGTFNFNPKNKKVNMIKIQVHKNWISIFKQIQEKILEYLNIETIITIDRDKYVSIKNCRYDNILKFKDEFIKLNIPLLERKWNRITQL